MGTDPRQFFYEAFNCMCRHRPYSWQEQLFLGLIAGNWPEVVPLPTGSGKTSVLHVWLLALAWSLQTGAGGIPRRLAWVVNRRVVVDQVTKEAEDLVNGGLAQCPQVADLLRRASLSGVPLAVSTLRGQHADDGAWACDPSTPAIVVGTVDMIGSRLLFRGYRAGRYHRPVHAGLLGVDTLIVNDEAHLSRPFALLLREIYRLAPADGLPGKGFRVMLLSATSADSGLRPFQHSPTVDADRDETFRKVFEAPKTLALHEGESKAFENTVLSLATQDPVPRTVVFIEAPEKAAAFATRLEKDGRGVMLLTGTMRGKERDELANDPLFKQFLDRKADEKPVWLVATSAAEVGVNLTCERLVTGLVEADRLVQRFGRLNRFGTANGEAHLVYSPPKEDCLLRALEYLHTLGGDISCRNIWEHQPPREACSEQPKCARFEDRLVEAWAQTTYRDGEMPHPVAPWLHGQEDKVAETEIAWRTDVSKLAEWGIAKDQIEDILERYAVRPHERLREPARRVRDKLEELVGRLGEDAKETRVIQVGSDGSVDVVTLPMLIADDDLAYKLLILPDAIGALHHGMFRPERGSEAGGLDEADWGGTRCRYLVDDDGRKPLGQGEKKPLEGDLSRSSLAAFAEQNGLRFPLIVREPDGDGMLLYFTEAAGKKRTSRDVLLSDHESAVAEKARDLAERAGLASMAEQFERAGLLHDRGKRRDVWQRAFGANTNEPIAKSKAPMNTRLLDGYRHELGSLVDAGEESDDLVLHLVASHHKGARPFFTDRQVDRENVTQSEGLALEAARRYARLQRQFGPWGLAYLEAIFKCADALVSAQEGGAVSE